MSDEREHPVLIILNGEQANQHWILEPDEVIIGRDEMCDIVISKRQISRQHVRIFRDSDEHCIEDLDSRNGTWVNGNRIDEPTTLQDGDEIHIALASRIRFIGSGTTAPITHELPDVIPSFVMSGRLQIHTDSRRVIVNGEEIDPPLSLPQYRLIELLYLNAGRICTREQVVDAVWPEAMGEGVSEQAIDALVRRLRDRLSTYDEDWQYIVTVRGHGFRLNNPEDTP